MTASPALCRRNMQWWNCKYRRSNQSKQGTLSESALNGFYRAIRENQVDQVQRFIAKHPAAVFTKGNNQRTALYIASFFGRHKVVRLLLSRGADKDLLCNGQRPIDVAGFASSDAVDRMKVRSLLQGDACPQVILRLDDNKRSASGSSTATGAASETCRLRVQIHFSEPVTEFTLEDITVSNGCVVTSFLMLRTDLYVATVQLPINVAPSVELSVEIPAGAARAARDGRCSAQSRPLQLAPA